MSDVIVEKNIRFSESSIWRSQKKYYNAKGISAWDEDVPFYITSNPFIANQYALVLIRFMQDWIRKNPGSEAHPFYILELGAGTGQFGFYVLKALSTLRKKLSLASIRFQYIMSDMSNHAFDFWKNHNALRPFLDDGILDFAVYDLYHSESLELHCAQQKITIQNPLLVIANYLFDSIATDVFSVKDGKLFESRVTVKTPKSNIKEQRNGVEIPIHTLSYIVRKYNVNNASLKIDCEGCEYKIISSSPDDILKKFTHIIMEYHNGYKELKSKLEKLGFQVSVNSNANSKMGILIAKQ